MNLYIRSIEDNPHAMDPETPGLSKCGEILLKAKAISEAQAIIWLGDRRCAGCFPGYQHKAGRHQHKASGNNWAAYRRRAA